MQTASYDEFSSQLDLYATTNQINNQMDVILDSEPVEEYSLMK